MSRNIEKLDSQASAATFSRALRLLGEDPKSRAGPDGSYGDNGLASWKAFRECVTTVSFSMYFNVS